MQTDAGPITAAGMVAQLARMVQRVATRSGDYPTALAGLTLHRRNRTGQVVHCIYAEGLAVTLQGSKHVRIGEMDLTYGAGQSLLTAIDLPVSFHVTRATAAEPYLGILLGLDRSRIAQIASRLEGPPARGESVRGPVSLQRLDVPLLDAFRRLLALLDEPELVEELAPLIEHEIVVRLLRGPHGGHLWALVRSSTPENRIVQSVSWIRQHLAEEMRVEALAEAAHMSITAFRQHFKATTGLSPVQFQKRLRLQEARQLMLDENVTAGSAAALVGYESASQFNREYRRLFGAPPQREIRDARGSGRE